MSGGLVRKVFPCLGDEERAHTGNPTTSHDAVAAASVRGVSASDVPTILRKFTRVLSTQKMLAYTKIDHVVLRARLQVQESDVRRGVIGYQQTMQLLIDDSTNRQEEWQARFADPRNSLPHALSVLMVSYDASQMPFDTQISLRGFDTEYERRMGERVPCDSSLRDYIMLAESAKPRGDTPFALLTRPLACTEALTRVDFASVEAIGFNSRHFLKKIAQRVTEAKVASVSRLFSRTIVADAPALSGDSDSGATGALYYTVPLSYRYASLMTRLHIYLTLQRLRRESVYELDVDSVDSALYQLPATSEYVIFERSSLYAVVRYIDERLIDVHPVFQPAKLRVTIEPVNSESWTHAWTARNNTGRALDALALANGSAHRVVECVGENKQLSCEATFIIYYAVFRRETHGDPLHALLSSDTTNSLENESVEDDEESYTTQTEVPQEPPKRRVKENYGSLTDWVDKDQLAQIDAAVPNGKSKTTAEPASSDEASEDESNDNTKTPIHAVEEPLRPMRAPPPPPRGVYQGTIGSEDMHVSEIGENSGSL
jgi:hypothetical protein